MRGTERREFQAIYDALESSGASLGFSAGVHSTRFGGKALVEDLDLLLDILKDCLEHPRFPPDQVERVRALLLANLAIRAQDTAAMASLAFDQIMYPDHPYSRPEDGFMETVERIDREDLIRFHQDFYGPRGMVIVIVGGIEPEKAIEKVERYFEDWINPSQNTPDGLPELKVLAEPTQKTIKIPGKSQADIVMGFIGPKRKDPGYIAAALANNILGQFGMYGRIGKVIREREGLAYYAYSNLQAGIGPGAWTIEAGVDPKNIDKVIELSINELHKFTEEPVQETELEDSKSNFIGRLPLSLESNSGVASALLNLEWYDLGLNYYLNYYEMIRSVTIEELHEITKQYMRFDQMGIALAGP